MRSVYTEKFQWAWSGFVNREFQKMKGDRAKLIKMEIFSIGMFHKENMSSINLFQTKGLSELAASSRFSRSAMEITEKGTF